MKKVILGAFIGIFLMSAVAFRVAQSIEPTKATANVEQIEGLYLYIKSKPVMEYDYLGSSKIGVTWSGKASEAITAMIKNVKKDYPQANAIIFTDPDLYKADAVKIK